MVCSLCGRDNRDNAKFCDSCGAALDRTVTRTGVDPELDAIRKASANTSPLNRSSAAAAWAACTRRARRRSIATWR